MKNTVYLNKELQNDNVYGDVAIVKTEELLGMPVSQKMAQTIISNGKGVHTCSPSYGLLPNKDFFGKMEHELIEQHLAKKVINSLISTGIYTITVEDLFKEVNQDAIRLSYISQFTTNDENYDIEFGELAGNNTLTLID